MAEPTGEAGRGVLKVDFDRRLVLQFRGSAITSCQRKIEMSPVAQSRDDTPVGGGDDERDGFTTKRWARANDIWNCPVCWLTQACNRGLTASLQ
jgi:hypothetical protein